MKRLLACLALLAVTTACVPDGLLFIADERVTITAPEDRAEVTLPLTVTWDVDGFDVEPPGSAVREDGGHFAVYIDRSPVRPGEPVTEERDVIITTATEVTIERLFGSERLHEVTVILVDGAGNRMGESAFNVSFDVLDPEEGSA